MLLITAQRILHSALRGQPERKKGGGGVERQRLAEWNRQSQDSRALLQLIKRPTNGQQLLMWLCAALCSMFVVRLLPQLKLQLVGNT